VRKTTTAGTAASGTSPRHLLDRERGSWRHELNPDNRPAARTWHGKPDIYHAIQATLVPRLPLAPSFAGALRGQARLRPEPEEFRDPHDRT
jgi:mannose/cellobiose epimerase-like protein (N-acyl-D-glucosamine 2-epimerase family)